MRGPHSHHHLHLCIETSPRTIASSQIDRSIPDSDSMPLPSRSSSRLVISSAMRNALCIAQIFSSEHDTELSPTQDGGAEGISTAQYFPKDLSKEPQSWSKLIPFLVCQNLTLRLDPHRTHLAFAPIRPRSFDSSEHATRPYRSIQSHLSTLSFRSC